jgi:hypothetical protein
VNGQLHASAALLRGKEPLVTIGQEAEWDPEPMMMMISMHMRVYPYWPPGARTADDRALCH